MYDANGNGYVDNGTEVFGSQWSGGFTELAERNCKKPTCNSHESRGLTAEPMRAND